MDRLSRAVQNQFNDKKEREDIANLPEDSKKVYFRLRGVGKSHEEALKEYLNYGSRSEIEGEINDQTK